MRKSSRLLNSSAASFDPLTLTVDLSGVLNHLKENLQKENYSKFSDAYIRSTYIHERVHWLQHIGTSIGFFRQYNQHFRINHIQSIISSGEFRTPLSTYFQEVSDSSDLTIPIVEDGEIFDLYFGRGQDLDNAKKIKALTNFAICSEFLESLIDGMELDQLEIMTPGDAIFNVYNEIIQDLFLNGFKDNTVSVKSGTACYPLQLTTDTIKYLFEIAHINNGPIRFVFSDEAQTEMFSGYHLMEGQARQIELCKLGNVLYEMGMPEQEIDSELNTFANQAPYNIAFNFFKTFFPSLSENSSRLLFLIICDYSLSPLVPPFVNDVGLYLQGSFNLIPQIRFFEICRCLSNSPDDIIVPQNPDDQPIEVEMLDNVKTFNKYIEVIYNRINRETGYPSPLDIARKFLTLYDDQLNGIATAFNDSLASSLLLFRKACEVRIECPLYFVDIATFSILDRDAYLELNKKLDYYIVKYDGDTYQSKYRDDEYLPFVENQIVLRFIDEILNNEKADMRIFLQYPGISKQFILDCLNDRIGIHTEQFVIL